MRIPIACAALGLLALGIGSNYLLERDTPRHVSETTAAVEPAEIAAIAPAPAPAVVSSDPEAFLPPPAVAEIPLIAPPPAVAVSPTPKQKPLAFDPIPARIEAAQALETATAPLLFDHFAKVVAMLETWRAQVAAAPMPPPPARANVAAADLYPGLPAFTLSTAQSAGDPDGKQLALATDWAAVTGGWARHLEALQIGLVRAAGLGPWLQHAQNLERILELSTPRLALEQARFIRAVGEAALTDFAQDGMNRKFLEWLLGRTTILAAFNDTRQPQDQLRNALVQWRVIWSDDPENREKLASLAIACALVFDEPVKIDPAVFSTDRTSAARVSAGAEGRTEASALARFRFFRDSAKKGALRTAPAEMEPWELAWVVDAPVPESELVWAQKYVNYPRRKWGEAYGHIRYRMDRAAQGVNPYAAYTLAEIEKEGGICGDQAYFAAISAKANGIPAMIIGGEGDRGAHAWVGYSSGRNEWNLTTGRYADNFAAGTTRHPQTGQPVKEDELRQLTDPARRTAAYRKSASLVALAAFFTGAEQRALATLASEAALRAAPKNYAAWTLKLDQLAAKKTPAADWLRESGRMRTAFREFADLVQDIDRRETEFLLAAGQTEAARKLVRLQTARMERKDESRTDLILESVFREVELAENAGDTAAVARIFRDALRSKGDEIVGFRSIADRFYKWAKTQDQAADVTRELISFFDRRHATPGDDVFALGAYREVLARLIAMAGEQGLERQQRSLQRREEKLGQLEEKAGQLQSRGADR